jgi:hypothetical protein
MRLTSMPYEPNRVSLCDQGRLLTNKPHKEMSTFSILLQLLKLVLYNIIWLLFNYYIKAQEIIISSYLRNLKV